MLRSLERRKTCLLGASGWTPCVEWILRPPHSSEAATCDGEIQLGPRIRSLRPSIRSQWRQVLNTAERRATVRSHSLELEPQHHLDGAQGNSALAHSLELEPQRHLLVASVDALLLEHEEAAWRPGGA